MEGKEINKIKDAIRSGKYPRSLDLCDEVIKKRGRSKDFGDHLIIGIVKQLLGVTLGLQTAEKQKKGHFGKRKINEMWKPAFSSLRAAIAYQTIVGDKVTLAETLMHIVVFRLQKGEDFNKVSSELHSTMEFVKAVKKDTSHEGSLERLRHLEDMFYYLNPETVHTINIGAILTA